MIWPKLLGKSGKHASKLSAAFLSSKKFSVSLRNTSNPNHCRPVQAPMQPRWLHIQHASHVMCDIRFLHIRASIIQETAYEFPAHQAPRSVQAPCILASSPNLAQSCRHRYEQTPLCRCQPACKALPDVGLRMLIPPLIAIWPRGLN